MQDIKHEKSFADEMEALADEIDAVSALLSDSCEAIEQGACCAVISRAASRYRNAAERLRGNMKSARESAGSDA